MTDDRLRSYGVLLLRVALGTMFIAHSMIYMLMTLTLDGTAKFFVSIDCRLGSLIRRSWPRRSVNILILGIQTRWVALALSPILIGATWAHAENGWLFASENGGWGIPSTSSFSALRKPCSATAHTRLPRRACAMAVQAPV